MAKKNKITQASDQQIINQLEQYLDLKAHHEEATSTENEAYKISVLAHGAKQEALKELGEMVNANFAPAEEQGGRFILVNSGDIYNLRHDEGFEHCIALTKIEVHE